MSDPVAPARSTWELVEAMIAEEERAIDGLSREQLVARYVDAGIDPADVEAHVDAIIREREARRAQGDGSPAPVAEAIQALTPEELDGELLAAGIEPESLRRIARQVFAQFGIDDPPPSQE
jgi:alkanesulfonate monooxygenase SsuD/methylene tetrahydromethanopterin reductase-like flavin-dependent oxidoreductase (luciferase family)